MIKKFINWIKNIFTPEKQDPHLEMYEELRSDKSDKILRKYKGSSE
jgi:hypothetical protein